MKKCSKSKTILKGGVVGIIIHSILCPIHGIIPLIALKIGIAEFIGLGFLYKFHEYITEKFMEPFISLFIKNNVEKISHITIDLLGILIAISIPVYFIIREFRKKDLPSKKQFPKTLKYSKK